MSTGSLILIIVQAAVFAAWTYLMFRTLFQLARRARKTSGATFPGVAATLTQWRIWLTSQEDSRARKTLAMTTLCLFALTGLSVLG